MSESPVFRLCKRLHASFTELLRFPWDVESGVRPDAYHDEVCRSYLHRAGFDPRLYVGKPRSSDDLWFREIIPGLIILEACRAYKASNFENVWAAASRDADLVHIIDDELLQAGLPAKLFLVVVPPYATASYIDAVAHTLGAAYHYTVHLYPQLVSFGTLAKDVLRSTLEDTELVQAFETSYALSIVTGFDTARSGAAKADRDILGCVERRASRGFATVFVMRATPEAWDANDTMILQSWDSGGDVFAVDRQAFVELLLRGTILQRTFFERFFADPATRIFTAGFPLALMAAEGLWRPPMARDNVASRAVAGLLS